MLDVLCCALGASILLMLLLPRGLMGVVQDLRHPQRRRRSPSALQQWRRWLLGDSAASDRAALIDQPGVVGAWLVPASPLLLLKADEARYAELLAGMRRMAREIEALEPDTLVIYSTRWFAVRAEPAVGSSGDVVGLRGVSQDITVSAVRR